MAESVTPEASQFWRRSVIELQAKLRALHEKGIESHSIGQPETHGNANEIMRSNERLLTSLSQNIGYVPPNQDELRSTASASVCNNSIVESVVESRAPSVQHNVNDGNPRDMEVPMVDVVAPADLPEGFQFEAEIQNKLFIATVPAGGVSKGDTFSCYMKEKMRDSDIPIGRWRDGLFDCLKHGPLHPMLLNSLVCPLLGLSQVMSRSGLDFMGRKSMDRMPRRGFWSNHRIMVSIVAFWATMNVAIISGFEYKLHSFVHLSSADIASLILVNGLMILFTVYATVNTRHNVREEFHIGPGRLASRTDDLVSSVCCLPLVVAQMGRHTASYEDYNGVCCNEMGIPDEHDDQFRNGNV
jgi:Cys-rich protein (TIGR01571 family)